MILISGANGFVGRALVTHIKRTGHGVRRALRSVRIGVPCRDDVVVGDINDRTDWSKSLDGIDTVVHLAARVHVLVERETDPLAEFCAVNAKGTERLAQQAMKAGVRRFVYLSTIKVHGETTDGRAPFRENSPLSPQDSYAISKVLAEKSLRRMAADTGLEVVIVRPPLVYGVGVKANFLQLLKLVDMGVPLPFASIQNRRSMIYIENLVDAIWKCVKEPSAAGKTFLVSDAETLPTPTLIRLIAAAMAKPSRLFPFPHALLSATSKLPGGFRSLSKITGSLEVDSSKIRNELGWTPPYAIEDGIGKSVDWFQNTKYRKHIR